jgi:hypothetical protein
MAKEKHVFMEWEALSHQNDRKPRDWYVAVLIIATALIGAALFTQNFLFAVFVFLAVFVLFLEVARKPHTIQCAILDRGIQVGDRFYPYYRLVSFWIHDTKKNDELLLSTGRLTMPLISIPLPDDIDQHEIRDILREVLPEVPHEKNLIDTLTIFLGF